MNILGIGPLELILVLLVVLLVLGPEDLIKAGRKLGRLINTLRRSDAWNSVNRAKKTLSDLPGTLMREAELEDIKKEFDLDSSELKNITKELRTGRLYQITAETEAGMKREQEQGEVPQVAESVE
jgi:Sec-independent protein translocase protein TatA